MTTNYIIILTLFIVACNSPEQTNVENENTAVIDSVEVISSDTVATLTEPPVFYSDIRKEEEIIVGKIYTDTLTFVSFNDDYDYFYSLFLTQQRDSVYMVCNDDIAETNEDRTMIVTWLVDSLYEAGEGDELYYSERMIKYTTNWELEENFATYLKEFTVSFMNLDATMNQYINSEIGFYSSNKMGVYCLLSKPDSIEKREWMKDFSTVVFDFIPYGDICEGYKESENGFYFGRTLSKKLPTFERYTEDTFVEEKYELPAKFEGNEYMKVTIINNGFYRGNLYFIQIENKWYFFAQDLCDCSA